MNKPESLTNDLIEQVKQFNSTIKITDFYPMESVIFYLDELDVDGIDQMLPLNGTKSVRVTYVAADADDYDLLVGDVYSSRNEYYGRMLVANQQLISYWHPGEERWLKVKNNEQN
jgi:hypothetical protein